MSALDREELIRLCDMNLKAVRSELSFNQEKMAYILGISKKTLVEIEKGRSSLGWTGSVSLCCIFGSTDVIRKLFPDDPTGAVRRIAFEGGEPEYRKAHSTRVWWHTVFQKNGFAIEQNIVSQHYRLVSPDNSILASSFDLDELRRMI